MSSAGMHRLVVWFVPNPARDAVAMWSREYTLADLIVGLLLLPPEAKDKGRFFGFSTAVEPRLLSRIDLTPANGVKLFVRGGRLEVTGDSLESTYTRYRAELVKLDEQGDGRRA